MLCLLQRQRPAAPAANDRITIDDFAKIELRVGIVKVAERVPKADKLLRLEIRYRHGSRQVLAGIAEAYAPETLVGVRWLSSPTLPRGNCEGWNRMG